MSKFFCFRNRNLLLFFLFLGSATAFANGSGSGPSSAKGRPRSGSIGVPPYTVQNPEILSVMYDAKERGTRVGVRFSVVDSKGAPVNQLRPGETGQFRIFLDGVEETSFETLSDATSVAPKIGITMVLDTSLSMERAKALAPMKRAAEHFESRLKSSSNIYTINYYTFSTDVKRIPNLKSLNPTESTGRFTSLYSAVKTAITENPNNIILLFSDGADNKSIDNTQARVASVREIQDLIESRKTVIHTVKLGLEDSNDMQGVSNREVLSRISKYGSLRMEADPERLVDAFEAVAQSIPYPYFFSYLCPRTSPGSYKLTIEIDGDGRATDRTSWKADAKFDLPFVIGNQPVNSNPWPAPGQGQAPAGNRDPSMYPVLVPSYQGSDIWPSNWNVMKHFFDQQNGGHRLIRAEHTQNWDFGSLRVSFTNVDLQSSPGWVRAVVSVSGPEADVNALVESSKRSIDSVRIGLVQHQISAAREVVWDSLGWIFFLPTAVENLGNGTAVSSSRVELKLRDRMLGRSQYLSVTGDYFDRTGTWRLLQVTQGSLEGFR